jgi:AcrR family transcriptional regulator
MPNGKKRRPQGAGKLRNPRPEVRRGRSPKSASNVMDLWWSNPKNARLVKSQVEDPGLINQRRAQFVKMAITLFCRKGYHVTTVKEIAQAAGVSPGLIYQYVTDKEDILFLALQFIVHTTKQVVPAGISKVDQPILKFVAAFKEYCQVMDENRHAVVLTYRETKSLTPEHREAIKNMELETNELIADCVKACISAGYFRMINVELFVYQAIMIAHTWALKHWRLHEVTTIEDYIRINLDNLLNSVLTKEGWRHYLMLTKGRVPSGAEPRSFMPTRATGAKY